MRARRDVESELRRWLRNHYSVIGCHEAQQLGASKGHVLAKAASGEWERMYRGVYRAAAAASSPYQALRAAFVATSGCGVVSHASAAWIWGMIPDLPAQPELSIGPTSDAARRRAGLTIHRSRDLDLSAAVNRNTVLVTNPLRTLVDLAASASPATVSAAVDAALGAKLVTVGGLSAEIDRRSQRGRLGLVVLRRDLQGRGYLGAPTPSVLESKLHRLVAGLGPFGIPPPAVEVRAGPDGEYRLDVAWDSVRFAVEVDGYAWHSSPAQTQSDNARRNRLRLAGWTVLVYGWLDLSNDQARVTREIVGAYRECQMLAAVMPARCPTDSPLSSPAGGHSKRQGNPPWAPARAAVGFAHGERDAPEREALEPEAPEPDEAA